MLKLINANDVQLTLPMTMAWYDTPISRRLPLVEINQGSCITGYQSTEQREINLRGSIYFPVKQDIRDYMDDLTELLYAPPIRVYQSAGDNRFLYCYPTLINPKWMDDRREVELEINMIAPDPHFYSIELSETVNVTSLSSVTLSVNGNIPTYPIILINRTSGTLESLKIHNLTTDEYIEFSEDITTDGIIDTRNTVVQLNSLNALDVVNLGFLIDGLSLIPGDNEIEISGAGTFDFDFDIRWRSRWL